MSAINSIRNTFFEECEELLEALFEGLAEIEAEDHDDETINAIFRAVHSIKGGAGAFGLDPLVQFAHTYETVFDALRSKTLDLDQSVLHVLQRAGDQLSDHVEAARDERELEPDADLANLTALSALLGEDPPAEKEPEEEFSFDAMAISFDAIDDDGGDDNPLDAFLAPVDDDEETSAGLEVSFTPTPALYLNGHDPCIIFKCLGELADIEISIDHSSVPLLEQFAPEESYLTWNIFVPGQIDESQIRDAFEFVDGLCELIITPRSSATDIEESDVAPNQVEPSPEPVIASDEQQANETTEQEEDEKKDNPVAKEKPKPAKAASSVSATLRVDLERVDRLINTAGELIINQAMISQHIEEMSLTRGSSLAVDLEAFKQLAREIQEGVMAIRAQPVKPLFQRMARIVRETCDMSGKLAKLVTDGEMTEVDKTVVERLADPLTHMIRNAVDHGLESAEEREKAGKPECGTIRLTAAHRSGNVMIEISDDGGGLNRDRIRQIAIDKGLVSADADLSEGEIDALLFMPGFSTAEKVSNLSGRGVGMDVVRNAITALGGRITIQSVPGQGTTFAISLPLTLAVLDGMVITVAGQTMVAPIGSIMETIRPATNDLHKLTSDGDLIFIRGSYIPIVDVAACLSLANPKQDFNETVLLLVETETGSQCALAVDDIADQRQIVIKGLQGNYGMIEGISAATILGNGQIALIIDTESLAISSQEKSSENRVKRISAEVQNDK